MKTTLLLLITIIFSCGPLRAAEADSVAVAADTTGCRFNARQLIAPGALIAVGALGVSVKPFKQARIWVNRRAGYHKCSPYDDIIQYLPLAGYLGLEYCGVSARRPIVDRTITAATGFIIMSALTQGTKHLVREPRPSGHRSSFPSGHTATAFLGAELIRTDYGTWPGVAAYTVASGVAVMRIFNRRHWANDLLAGAGIGILSARAALWLLPLERRLFGMDRQRAAALVVPTYAPDTHTMALSAVIAF